MVPSYQISHSQFFFQDLHSQRDNGFSTMITRAIRFHLYKYLPKNEKDEFSLKYLRIASVTKMAAHRGVIFSGIHDTSGHSIGTNQERYLKKNPCTYLVMCACLEWVGGNNPKEIVPIVSLPWTLHDRTSSMPDKEVVDSFCTTVQSRCNYLPYTFNSNCQYGNL